MVFDDDVKLQGLYLRYQEELEELKTQIIVYIRSETFGSFTDIAQQSQDNTAD